MYGWELVLRGRRRACEVPLAVARRCHGEVVEERRRCQQGGPRWREKDDKLAALRERIRRELSEIYFIKLLANVGPIVGNKLVLHVRDGATHKVRPGPSIIDIIQREADAYDEGLRKPDGTETRPGTCKDIAFGLKLALAILYNPYRFLDQDERAAYDKAEAASQEIVEQRAERTEMPAPSLAEMRRKAEGVEVIRRGPRT